MLLNIEDQSFVKCGKSVFADHDHSSSAMPPAHCSTYVSVSEVQPKRLDRRSLAREAIRFVTHCMLAVRKHLILQEPISAAKYS